MEGEQYGRVYAHGRGYIDVMDQITVINGKTFECSQCGACCKQLKKVPQMADYDRGDGVCKYLLDNKCSIYNQRPNICRGEYVYHTFFEGMDVDEYYEMLYRYCDVIKEGVD